MDLRKNRLALATALSALAALVVASPARASGPPEGGYTLSSADAIEIAKRDPKVAAEERRWGHLDPSAQTKDSHWEVGFYKGQRELVLVMVDDATHEITESWTGYQVAWQMARGYPGAFGRKVNAPYVWLPLCGFFLLGLLDWRRWRRIVHLDLAVLLAFGVSNYFFNNGDIGVSVPLAYPVLLYLLARMLWIGFRGRGEGLRPTLSTGWLALGVIFLLSFRVALNLADANVIDVGYAGVIGADRATHGKPIWGDSAFPTDNQSGDTYGPVNYYAYVPFELAFPWSGSWDDLPAAHGASVAFDLLAVAGLFFLGRRIRPGPRGTRLGVILAYGWASYPYTAYALESNSNDTLVAALVIGALLLIASPAGRGAMTALAGWTKFAALALAPLFAVGVREPEPGGARRLPDGGDGSRPRPREQWRCSRSRSARSRSSCSLALPSTPGWGRSGTAPSRVRPTATPRSAFGGRRASEASTSWSRASRCSSPSRSPSPRAAGRSSRSPRSARR